MSGRARDHPGTATRALDISFSSPSHPAHETTSHSKVVLRINSAWNGPKEDNSNLPESNPTSRHRFSCSIILKISSARFQNTQNNFGSKQITMHEGGTNCWSLQNSFLSGKAAVSLQWVSPLKKTNL